MNVWPEDCIICHKSLRCDKNGYWVYVIIPIWMFAGSVIAICLTGSPTIAKLVGAFSGLLVGGGLLATFDDWVCDGTCGVFR